MSHPFECLRHDLAARQLVAVRDELGAVRRRDFAKSRPGRMADLMCEGLRALSKLESADDESTLPDAHGLARSDPRFAFLQGLPRSAAFGWAMGSALAEFLTGRPSQTAAEVTGTMNAFITALDGLLDKAEGADSCHVKMLLDWVRTPFDRPPPARFADGGATPAEKLVHFLAESWRRTLTAADGYAECKELRGEIVDAVGRAVACELASADLAVGRSEALDSEALAEIARGRAVEPVWAVALAVPCVVGLPDDMTLDRYRRAVEPVGELCGWLDDVCDLDVDVFDGRWNAVSLALLADGHRERPADDRSLLFQLMSLQLEPQMPRLASTGARHFRNAMRGFEGRESAAAHRLLDDLAVSWLGSAH